MTYEIEQINKQIKFLYDIKNKLFTGKTDEGYMINSIVNNLFAYQNYLRYMENTRMTMPKYINASEAEMIIESEAENLYGEGLDVSAHRLWKLQNKIRDMPAADVRENIHGEWKSTEALPHNVYCSNCYKRYAQEHWIVWEDGSLPRNFCSNCGADMRERKETE